MADIAALKTALDGLVLDDDPAVLTKYSRDFYWYSPILKRDLDKVRGELMVTPRDEAEVLRVLAAAFRHQVPLTPRGTGTGNYGQAMPLAGGLILNLAGLNTIAPVAQGAIRAGAGALIGAIDEAAKAAGCELRMFPSTRRIATIGGFIAGGSGGVGSIRWGGLRDLGNIKRLRLVTMEAEPRILDLEGADIAKVAHAYGTNGIITEVEMPLTAAQDWLELIIGFADVEKAIRFADQAGNQDGILLKELAVVEAPVAQKYFTRHGGALGPTEAAAIVMVAPSDQAALSAVIARTGGTIRFRTDTLTPEERHGLPPVYELGWNHTTLHARRVDPALTYLQVLYPGPDHAEQVLRMSRLIGAEMMGHLEFMRFDGRLACTGLPLVRFTTEQRLDAIVRCFEDNGCLVFNPHRYTLEEGGMKQSDLGQLAFKRAVDPQGLLNPGKMIAWDDPDFDFTARRVYLFPGLAS